MKDTALALSATQAFFVLRDFYRQRVAQPR